MLGVFDFWNLHFFIAGDVTELGPQNHLPPKATRETSLSNDYTKQSDYDFKYKLKTRNNLVLFDLFVSVFQYGRELRI